MTETTEQRKARPIIFSGDMIRALIDGRKTQTRRVIKGVPNNRIQGVDHWCNEKWRVFANGPVILKCPYGQAGDLIWDRETWSGDYAYADQKPTDRVSVMTPDGPYYHDSVWYWADGEPEFEDWERPRPSIHMPRWASRLTLRITDVRVERVQDMSEGDAVEEGARRGFPTDDYSLYLSEAGTYYGGFSGLWDSINAKRGHDWDSNPWVWVIEFDVIRMNVDDVIAGTNQ